MQWALDYNVDNGAAPSVKKTSPNSGPGEIGISPADIKPLTRRRHDQIEYGHEIAQALVAGAGPPAVFPEWTLQDLKICALLYRSSKSP